MCSQFESITFNDLQTLPQERLERISADKVVEISLKALENYSTTDTVMHVFKCWARKFIDIYHLSEITVGNIRRLFCAFVDQTTKILDSTIAKSISKESIDLLISLLINWRDITSRIDVKSAHLARASILIESSLKTLANYYSLLKNSKNSLANGLAILFDESQNFQKLILSIMLDNFDMFVCRESAEVDDIIKIINCLSIVGEIVPLLDVKLTAEIWKFLSKLSSENSAFMKHSIDEDCTVFWLERPVKFLCEEIKNSISSIYEQVPDQSLDRVERILKINSFYLKLLIKFASDFEQNHFAGSAEVAKTGFTLLTNSETIAGTKVENLIKQYLTVGFMNLFNLIYKNKEFIQALYEEPITNIRKFEGLYIILSEICKNLILEENVEATHLYLSSESNIIEKLFTGILKYPGVLLKKENYETLLTVTSALMLSKCDCPDVVECFEKLLVDGVLQNNLLLANLCIDIWLTISRFISSEARYRYFSLWADICLKFPLFSLDPRAIYVQNLLKSMYDFLSNSCKEEVWNGLFKSEANSEKLILTLGIERIPNDNKRESLRAQRIRTLCELLEGSARGVTKQDYYSIVANTQILKSTSLINSTKLLDLVINFLTNLLQKCENTRNHVLLISSLIEFVSKHINIFPNNQLTLLTNILSFNISKITDTTIKLCIVKFLGEILKINESQTQKNLFDVLQKDTNELVKIFLQIHCKKFQSTTLIGKILSDTEIIDYFYKVPIYNFNHKCKLTKHEEFENIKRLRLDEENPLLRNILQDSYTILDTFKVIKPTAPDIKLIRTIVNIFEQVLNDENKT